MITVDDDKEQGRERGSKQSAPCVLLAGSVLYVRAGGTRRWGVR